MTNPVSPSSLQNYHEFPPLAESKESDFIQQNPQSSSLDCQFDALIRNYHETKKIAQNYPIIFAGEYLKKAHEDICDFMEKHPEFGIKLRQLHFNKNYINENDRIYYKA